jgi:hypothetical protein
VSSASVSRSAPAGRKPVFIILAVIGVLAIILGVLYLVAGTSLPGFLTAGSHVKSGNHLDRGGVCLVVGVIALIGSWITGRRKAHS